MPDYAQISIHTFTRKRRDGSLRRYEFRLTEQGAAGGNLPFDLNSAPVIQTGSNSHDLTATIKPTQVSFRIKTVSELAEKLRTAEDRQYRLTIRELEGNQIVFEGYIKPDFPRYDIFKKAKTVQVTATGELASLEHYNADGDLRTLYDIFHRINQEAGFPTRSTDFYMRTRYNGQSLSDPIPSRLWMSELGKIGAEEGFRDAAVRQVAQEFNFQIFQHNGRLVIADVYERLRNPESVNRYLGGAGNGSDNLLIELDESNIDRSVGGQEVSATGQRRQRVGRVVQQRQFLKREETFFPRKTVAERITQPVVYSLPGRVTGGDIIRITRLSGYVEVGVPDPIPPQWGPVMVLQMPLAAFRFRSEVDGLIYYYDFSEREWVPSERWATRAVTIREYFQIGSGDYQPGPWEIEDLELAEIPEEQQGELELVIRREVDDNLYDISPSNLDMYFEQMHVGLQFNDRPDDLFYQAIAENGSGQSHVYPLYESDYDIYSGEKQVMRIGADQEIADSEWIDEDDSSVLPFADLIAKRKAWMLLGSADRVHLVVNDVQPISLLNVISFQDGLYLPVAIKHNLWTGSQEIWMLPARGLDYDFSTRYTYNPEELTSSARGVTQGWVTNRIINSMNSNIAAGSIAMTIAAASGLIESIEIDRENLLFAGDTIDIINPFSLERVRLTVSEDQQGNTVFVEPENLMSVMPAGSYVFAGIDGLASGVRQSRYATQMYSDFAGVGVLWEDVDGVVSALPVHLFVKIRGGSTMKLHNAVTGITFTFTVDADSDEFFEGTLYLPIKPAQLVLAPADSIITLGNSFLSSLFQVDPGKVLGRVRREQEANGIGVLSTARTGAVTNIALMRIPEDLELRDGQILRIYNREGRNEKIIVDGDQSLTAGLGMIQVRPITLSHEYIAEHSYVNVPGYELTGLLNITAGRTEILQTASSDQAEAMAGLIIDVNDLDSAQVDLFARVEGVEDGLDVESDARIQLRADLDGAEASLVATINRVGDNENAIDGLQSAQAGLINTVGNVEDAFDNLDDDFRDFLQNDFEGLVDDIGAQSVLYTEANGNVAAINLVSGQTGTGISLSADLVRIQGWQFVEATGVLRSLTQIGGRDAIRLNGVTGVAEFQDAIVRRSFITETELENLSITGTLLLEGVGRFTNSGNDFLVGAGGIKIAPSTAGIPGQSYPPSTTLLSFGSVTSSTINAAIFYDDTGGVPRGLTLVSGPPGSNRFEMRYDRTQFYRPIVIPSYTTAGMDGLLATRGMLIHNSSAGRIAWWNGPGSGRNGWVHAQGSHDRF